MNIDHSLNNYTSANSSSPKLNKKSIVAILAVLGCVALIACACWGNKKQVHHMENGIVSLWERECYTCTKCKDDRIQIISVTYGDRVITGDFVHMYNNGIRTFPAGDTTWGETWKGVKKTMVLVFKMCDAFYTKVITEGQALVLP